MTLVAAFLALVLVLSIGHVDALFKPDDGVLILTPDNFKKEISGPKVAIVAFTASFCGWCKKLVEPYKVVAGALRGIATVAGVDAEGAGKSLGTQFGVQGFPTIKLFGASKKKPTDFEGDRSALTITRAVIDEIEKTALARVAGKTA